MYKVILTLHGVLNIYQFRFHFLQQVERLRNAGMAQKFIIDMIHGALL